MSIFGDLSYKSNKLAPIGSPVELLSQLYEKKQKDYDYVVDNSNLLESAMTNMNYNEIDAPKVAEASDYLKSTIENFQADGALEDKVLDVKRLAKDMDTKFGLKAIQDDYAAKQAYIKELKEQYSKGDIFKQDMDRNIEYSNRKNTGVQKGEAGFTKGFSGRTAIKAVNLPKEVLEIVKGIKSDSIIGSDGLSYKFESTGNGYINLVTGEAVTEEKVAQVAKEYLLNNNSFKDRVNEEVFFELDKFLTDPETNEQRDMTFDDLTNLTGVSQEAIEKKYGKKLDVLDPEAIYKDIRKQELANQYIKPAVTKEAYIKLDNKFLQDWQLKASSERNAAQEAANTIKEAGVLQTYASVDKYTAQDFDRTAKVYGDAKANINNLKAEMETLKKGDPNPDQINRLQSSIDEQQRLVNLIESRNQEIIELNPRLKNKLQNFVTNFADTGANRANKTPFIHGLSINEGELERLVYNSSSGTLTDEELKKYIDFEKIKDSASSIEGASLVYKNSLKTLRDKVSLFGKDIKTTIENGDVLYNDNYQGIVVPDNITTEEKRTHPILTLESILDKTVKNNPQYYDTLIDVNTNLPLKQLIKEKEGIDDDEENQIKWSTAKMTPLIDKVPSSDGTYKNAIAVDVMVGKKDEEINKRYIVRSQDDSYNQLSESKIEEFRQQLLNKPNLNGSDLQLLTQVNLSRFNNTKEGRELDLLNLADMSNRETVNITLPNGIPGTIQAFKTASPQNKAYYLVKKEGNEIKYWAENEQGVRKLLTEEELATTKEYNALGGNTVKEIKTKIANIGYNSNAFTDKNYKVDQSTLIDISNIFGSNVKQGVDTRVSKEIEPSIKELKNRFPNLFLTDGLRDNDSEIGAKNSRHKEGKAIDLRYNSDSLRLVNMSAQEKNNLGIETASVHGEGDNKHIHITFI